MAPQTRRTVGRAEQEAGTLDWEAPRREVAYFMRRLYRQRLTTTAGGNVSCRAGDGSIMVTPAGTDKALVRGDDIAVLDIEGRPLTPDLRPTSEYLLHLRIYQSHPAVGAVVHAHPVTASAFACSQTPIDIGLLCETYALLETPVRLPYAESATEELAARVAEGAGRSCALLLGNHGAVTTGASLTEAFSRMEVLEEAARVTLLARQLEGVRHLTDEERTGLDRLMGRPER
jgi:L-fuculose-phosphate aldolase